jgi:hypothetical protein
MTAAEAFLLPAKKNKYCFFGSMPELNSPGGYEEFIEFWSYLRMRGKGEKDIYSTSNCPNCSAALPVDMGDSGKCRYCGAFVNSSEYDWMLAEITPTGRLSLQRL